MQLQKTKTGEFTVYIPSMDETYHSRDGAISESLHVFIAQGFQKTTGNIRILEVGFGTGLNALLTAIEAEDSQRKVYYHTLEPFQLPFELLENIGYGDKLKAANLFEQLHQSDWENSTSINDYFILHKTSQKLEYITLEKDSYDLIFFDAFAPKKQPELWSYSIFEKLYTACKPQGILTTYSAAGQLKRDLKSVGFYVENPPGANGKREMTVAIKK